MTDATKAKKLTKKEENQKYIKNLKEQGLVRIIVTVPQKNRQFIVETAKNLCDLHKKNKESA